MKYFQYVFLGILYISYGSGKKYLIETENKKNFLVETKPETYAYKHNNSFWLENYPDKSDSDGSTGDDYAYIVSKAKPGSPQDFIKSIDNCETTRECNCYKYPPYCKGLGCEYVVQWVMDNDNRVTFTVEALTEFGNSAVMGIGFGMDGDAEKDNKIRIVVAPDHERMGLVSGIVDRAFLFPSRGGGKKNVELQKAETIDMFKNAETQKDDSKLKLTRKADNQKELKMQMIFSFYLEDFTANGIARVYFLYPVHNAHKMVDAEKFYLREFQRIPGRSVQPYDFTLC